MKRIDFISDVFGISQMKNNLVVFTINNLSFSDQSIFIVQTENISYRKSFDEFLIYQLQSSNDMFLLNPDLVIIQFKGDFSISGAFKFKNGFVAANRQTRTYHYFELYSYVGIDLGFYFKNTGSINSELLFDRIGNKIKLFHLSKKQEYRDLDVNKEFGINESLQDGIFTINRIIFAPIKNGALLAIDITTCQLLWEQQQVGKTAFYDDKIYCVIAHSLDEIEIKVIDTVTGKVIQCAIMPNLHSEHGFLPTGHHKVYEEYIFVLASRRPGLVAIFDRKTLEFIEMIRIEESIPNDVDHLHWHNGRLYILDFGKTLHVLE